MKKIISKVAFKHTRGDILIGDIGETNSVIPNSSDGFPVWFEKHGQEFYYPIFMKRTEFDFQKKEILITGFDPDKEVYCNLCERYYKNYKRFVIHMKNKKHFV